MHTKPSIEKPIKNQLPLQGTLQLFYLDESALQSSQNTRKWKVVELEPRVPGQITHIIVGKLSHAIHTFPSVVNRGPH